MIASLAFAGCALLAAGFTAVHEAGGPDPDPSAGVLKIVLQAPPEPVFLPGPPVEVLPADTPNDFNLREYRQELAAARYERQLAEARLEAERYAWEQSFQPAPTAEAAPSETYQATPPTEYLRPAPSYPVPWEQPYYR